MLKKLAILVTLVAGPAVLGGSSQFSPNYAPSGPAPYGPGDAEWDGGPTVRSGTLPPAGGLDQARINKPLSDEWTSYSGDLSGKRFSALKLVNKDTVKALSLKWIRPLSAGCGPNGRPEGGAAAAAGGGGGNNAPAAPNFPMIVGGLASGSANTCGATRLSGGTLMVDGILYTASPYNLFAVDARDGTVLWQNYWKTRGGTALGSRGPGMLGNLVYFSEHDDWVIAVDARNGKEVWRHEVSPFDMQYFTSIAPMAIKGHILAGTGNDSNMPAFLKALNPTTGAM